MMRFRPLISRDLTRVSAQLSSIGDSWASDWLAGPTRDFSTTADLPNRSGLWAPLSSGSTTVAYVDLAPVFVNRLVAALTGTVNVDDDHILIGGAMLRLVHEAVEDLLLRISGLGDWNWAAAQPLPKSASHIGAGSVLLSLHVGGIESFRLVISHQGLASQLGATPSSTRRSGTGALERRSIAVQTANARVIVLLARDELPLGQLRDMRVGDVLTLNRRIDEPLDIAMPGEQIPAKCYLGRRGQQLAVTVTTTNPGKE